MSGIHLVFEHSSEPYFHVMRPDGAHGTASLPDIRDWARQELDQPGEALAALYRELYIVLPGGRSLLPCAITFAGGERSPKAVITGTAAVSGVLWTTDL